MKTIQQIYISGKTADLEEAATQDKQNNKKINQNS